MARNRWLSVLLCVLILTTAACAKAQPAAEIAPATATPAVLTIEVESQPTVVPAEAMPTPTLVPTPTPVPEPFTIVLFPDTQTSVYYEAEAMQARGKWVHDHAESDKIAMVISVGDLVNNGNKEKEWPVFYQAYDQFKDEVPFFCVAGNHDLTQGVFSWKGYLAQPCVQNIPDEQQYKDGMAAYTLFSAGGIDWIVIGAGFDAELDACGWMNEQLDAYPDRKAIMVFHRFLTPEDGLSTMAELIIERVVAKHDNVCLVLNGHYDGTNYERTIVTNPDTEETHVLHSMLFNYQKYKVDSAHMRTLYFDPIKRSIKVTTINPLSDKDWPDTYFGTSTYVIENAF